jgi:hypothetical protein
MKKLYFCALLILSAGCQESLERGTSRICPMIYQVPSLELQFNLLAGPPEKYRLFLNGEEVKKDCLSSGSCISREASGPQSLTLTLGLGLGEVPGTLDVALFEINDGLETLRLEEFAVNLEETDGPPAISCQTRLSFRAQVDGH